MIANRVRVVAGVSTDERENREAGRGLRDARLYTPLVPRPEGGALVSILPSAPLPDEQPRRSTPTSVYLYYDEHGLLLYVGITSRATTRQREHNTDKEWWGYVARQAVEHFPDRPAALSRESELILQFRPPFNRQQNPDYASMRETYLAFRASGIVATEQLTTRQIHWVQHRQEPDGTGTVLRSTLTHDLLIVGVTDGVRAISPTKKYGLVERIWRDGPFILVQIAGAMPPITAARSRVKWHTKPAGIRLDSLTVDVPYEIHTKKELKAKRYKANRRAKGGITDQRERELRQIAADVLAAVTFKETA